MNAPEAAEYQVVIGGISKRGRLTFAFDRFASIPATSRLLQM
jgi:hypothetical protein